MAKVKVFLSFEFDKDDELHHNFYMQAKECSQYTIKDYSLNDQYHPDQKWLEKARAQIKKSDIVIVVIRHYEDAIPIISSGLNIRVRQVFSHILYVDRSRTRESLHSQQPQLLGN